MPDGDQRRWQESVEPDLRRRILEKILGKLVQLYEGKPAPSQDLNRIATSFEQKMFCEANSKDDYIKRIAHKLVTMERNRQPGLQTASGLNQQVQMGCQMKPVDMTIQAIHGGDPSVTAISQVSPMISHKMESPQMRSLPITHSGSSPARKQHMTRPVAPKMHIKNGQTDAVTMSDQILKSSPVIVTPSSPCVHPSQLMMQPGGGQNQNKLPFMQTQPINCSSGNATSVAQPQGQQVIQPNGQQNLINQNTRRTCMLPQQQLRINQQSLEVNRQKVNRESREMLVAQQGNVANMQTNHTREWNNQQNAVLSVESTLHTNQRIKMEPQPLITANQQSSLHAGIPQTVASMGSVEEFDWREEMFHQMQALRDAYISELVELDQLSVVPKITKEEFESLPNDKAEQYKLKLYMKKRIRTMLNFLRLQKSNIPEHLKGQLPLFVKAIQNVLVYYRRKKDQRAEVDTRHQSHISHQKPQIIDLTGDPAPSSGCTSSQQKQPVESHLRQRTATRTPATSPENHSDILLGVATSCVAVRSPGSVQSLTSNKLQDYCTPSPITKDRPIKVSSPSASEKSVFPSPTAESGAVIGASPSVSLPIEKPDLKVASRSASAKSTLASPVATLGLQDTVTCAPAASPYSPVRSALSPLGDNSGVALVASPCVSMKSTSSATVETVSTLLQQNNAAAAASNVSTTNSLMPSSLLKAETVDIHAEDLQHGGPERPVAKKPMDRLIDAMCSLSPAALKSTTNLLCAAISMDDWVTDGEFNTFQHWTSYSKQGGSSPPSKMKRNFEITASDAGLPPLVDTWEVEANAEHGTKKQKTQNARNALLDEIESANSMLVDTIISIADDSRIDGITSSSEGTLIKLSYTAVALAPDLKSLFATSETPIVMPAKLLVPADYPRSSPVLVDDQRDVQRHRRNRNYMFNDISVSADVSFRNTLDGITEPRSIRETARAWDACVRRAVTEFAQRFGGGTFSSSYGIRWETCGGA